MTNIKINFSKVLSDYVNLQERSYNNSLVEAVINKEFGDSYAVFS